VKGRLHYDKGAPGEETSVSEVSDQEVKVTNIATNDQPITKRVTDSGIVTSPLLQSATEGREDMDPIPEEDAIGCAKGVIAPIVLLKESSAPENN